MTRPRTFWPAVRGALTTLAVAFPLAACGPSKLDRAQALAALEHSDKVVREPAFTAPFPRDGLMGRPCPGDPSLAPFERAGYVTSRVEQRGVYSYCASTLTPAGEHELGWTAVETPRGPFAPSARTYVAPMMTRVPVEVSGVAQSEGDAARARVEFTWRAKATRTTELLMADPVLGTPDHRAKIEALAKATHHGTAELRRYDDGWRVESVAFGT